LNQVGLGETISVESHDVAFPFLRGSQMILVTGGAGFIGSNFVLDWLAGADEPVVNFDKLTYAGNLRKL
jgi:FlaA1/EpsC-like NDP-sugar epimerase